MRDIKIIFSRPSAFFVPFAWVIMLYMWRWFSHVVICYVDEVTGFEMIAEASHGKVHLMEKTEWLKHNQVVREHVEQLDADEFTGMMRYVFKRLQRPYGFWQNIGTVIYDLTGLRVFENNEKHFNCSELVTRALPRVFRRLAKKPLDYVKPKGLYDLLFGED